MHIPFYHNPFLIPSPYLFPLLLTRKTLKMETHSQRRILFKSTAATKHTTPISTIVPPGFSPV